MKYMQLTRDQRCQIQVLLGERKSKKEIAEIIGCHRSTIYREMKRNPCEGVYNGRYAESDTRYRRKKASKHRKMNDDFIGKIQEKLALKWSPEQIAGYFSNQEEKISHETIYQWILKDKKEGGKWYKYLRHSRKKYRKRIVQDAGKDKIKNKVSIEQRPEIVANRTRIGDWEIDLMVGKDQTSYLVTMLERKSRYVKIRKVPKKDAEIVYEAIVGTLKDLQVLTITIDNGLEFAKHERFGKQLSAKVYFAHPYSSWERGANENVNGLIRQYIPKRTDISLITDEYIEQIEQELNERPRKILNYKNPKEIFEKRDCEAA